MSLNKKALGASAAVVALSAFVPNPFLMGEAMAQATASDTLKISAKVVNPLGVNSGTELDFGTFAVAAAAGTYTYNQTTTTINTSGGVIISAGQLGSVTFTAPKLAVFTISIADIVGGIFITNGTGGGAGATASKTMTVTALKFVSTAATKMTIGGATTQTFTNASTTVTAQLLAGATAGTGKATIGGILNTTSDQLVGSYSGTYTVSITF